MTRETKVGLVVASSFICLVGVVVASKLRHGDAVGAQSISPGNTQVAAASPEKKGKEAVLPGKENPGGVSPAQYQGPPPTSDLPGPGQAPPPAMKIPGTGTKEDNSISVPLPKPPDIDDLQKKAINELNNAVKDVTGGKGPVIKPGPDDVLASKNPPPIPFATTPPKIDPPPPAKDNLFPPPPGVEKASEPPAPPGISNLTIKPTPPKTVEKTETPAPLPPLPGNVEPPPPAPIVPAPTIATPPLPGTTNPPAATKGSEPTIPLVPPQENIKAPSIAPPVEPGNVPPPIARTPTPPPSTGTGGGEKLIPGMVPPLGANVTPPPLGASPSTPNMNKVTSVDVQAYLCKPEDNSFTAISQRVFNTDKYAKALLLYNRGLPFAAQGLLQEPPKLEPGTKVLIPPADYLESHFASAMGSGVPPPLGSDPSIPRPAPIPAPNPGTFNPPVIGSTQPVISNPNPTPPAPLGSGVNGPPPLTVRTPTPANTSDPTRHYRVKEQGQHIMEIAQQTLGSSMRWPEIYRLNPNLEPRFPIPGGTEIRLPQIAVGN